MKKVLLATLLLSLCRTTFAFPSFDAFANATSGGGTSYSPGSGLYHQTNALGEGWALWNGGSGSSTAEVMCVSSNLTYGGFPSGFPAPPLANSVSLPGSASAAAGYSAALQFSQAISADTNNLVTNKIFASFLMQIPNLGNLSSGSPIYFGGFATNTGDQNIGLPGKSAKLYLAGNAGPGASTSYAIGVQTANGTGTTAAYDAGGHTTASVLFVVMDYEFGINGNPDVINLWVNPASTSFGTVNAPTPSASITAASGGNGQLLTAADFYLLARNGSTLWGSMIVGDLRVGGTWCYATGGPQIVTAPISSTNGLGTTATFSVQAIAGATNVSPLRYQWRFNGVNLTNGGQFFGVTNSTLTISNIATTNAGTYSVVVSNSVAALTNSALLGSSDPGVASNPVSQAVLPGGNATFGVVAVGTPTLTYQWMQNGTNLTNGVSISGAVIGGAQTGTLQLTNVGDAENGAIFSCVVTNGHGSSALSTGATLTVGDPVLLSSPQAVSAALGATVHFSAGALGSAPLVLQWQKAGVNLHDGASASGANISGSSTTNLTISGVGYADAAYYGMVATNAHGVSVASPTALLTVLNPHATNQMDGSNVRYFGAKGDGVTDDTAAFNGAISAAETAGENEIYVPMGRYVISSPLTLNAVELVGKFAGGWPADNLSMPTLLIRQYIAPALTLTNGASVHGVAIDYDVQTPTTSNAPAISLQSVGEVITSVRIQNPYDGISTPGAMQPGRVRFSDILILQPAHSGIQISKCYDFVQFKHIEVRCPGTMSTGPAFNFGRVDEGDYTGLVASNCAIGIQFYADTDSGGGYFTGGFVDCEMVNCSNSMTATGDHKIKITGGDFISLNSGMIVNGTNAEITLMGGRWQANAGQAVQVLQAANCIFEGDVFCRASAVAAPLVKLNNATTVTVDGSQFLPGSTGLELDNLLTRAVVTGNIFEDGGITNLMTSSKQAIARNLFSISPPTNVTAVAGNGQVSLSWSAVLNAISYNVARSLITGGWYTVIASPVSTNYTDSAVTNGITYYYVVNVVKSGTFSSNSIEVNATPQVPPPSNLVATAGNAQVSLTWSTSAGATNYHVQRSLVSGGPYTLVAHTNITSYTDSGLTNGITYYYVVDALNSAGFTANSGEAFATPQLPIPAAPTGLMATATNGLVSLSWMPSAYATNYYVMRSVVSGGPYSFIGATPFAAWNDAVVWNGTAYYYVVIAANGSGESGPSSEVSALPQIVVDLNLSLGQNGHQMTLSWPSWATNLELFSTTNISPPVSWALVTNAVSSNNGAFSVTLPTTNFPQQFFQLNPP